MGFGVILCTGQPHQVNGSVLGLGEGWIACPACALGPDASPEDRMRALGFTPHGTRPMPKLRPSGAP